MIQIEVAPDVEQRFVDAARARGLEPEAYAGQLISSAVALTEEKHLSEKDFEDFLTRMASLGDKMPLLPEEAYTRESFYRDHD